MKYKTPAIIIAGGKSSRMGEDKALLPFKNYATLSEFQQDKLLEIFKNVYISTKKNKFDFKANLILDNYKESSPLIAIISIFEILQVDEIFILSVDTPLIDKKIIQTLFQNNNKLDNVIIPKSKKGLEPLCGIYKKEILPYAYKQLKNNNHKLMNLLEIVKTKIVLFEDENCFINLNYYEEYKKTKNLTF